MSDQIDRDALLRFAQWLLKDEVGHGHEEEMVDKYLGQGDDCEHDSTHKNCCKVSPSPRICHCRTHWHSHRRSEECEQLAKRDRYIDDLIEASSLGTNAAKAIRHSVDDESVQRILDRVNRERGLA